jgi:hypothetical protein
MDASDLIKQKRDRALYAGKKAVAQKPVNKTLQTDSQTLIDLKRGPQRVFYQNIVALPACDCPPGSS